MLTNLVKNILKGKEHTAIAVNANAKKNSDLQFRQAVVQLQVLGLFLTNIDPYKRDLTPLPAKSKLTTKLSGNNYVSASTQKAYQEVMNDGFKISGGSDKVVEKIVTVEKIVEKIVEVPATNGHSPIENEEEMINKEVLQLLQNTLESFKANQTKSLEIFERFMKEQNAQSQQLLQLMSQTLTENRSTLSLIHI